VGYDFARDELADALYRLTRLPEWLTTFDGDRADVARLKNLTSDLIGRFARPATTATREHYSAPSLTRYRGRVVVPRVIEAEMAVLKGIIGAFVVSIDGRKGSTRSSAACSSASRRRCGSAPSIWTGCTRRTSTAITDAARRRVVVDQVASVSPTGSRSNGTPG
jgi:dGTPase